MNTPFFCNAPELVGSVFDLPHPKLIRWLRADKVTVKAGSNKVDFWPDLSGGPIGSSFGPTPSVKRVGDFFQPSPDSTKSPVFNPGVSGPPFVHFDGNAWLTNEGKHNTSGLAGGSSLTPLTMIALVRPNALPSPQAPTLLNNAPATIMGDQSFECLAQLGIAREAAVLGQPRFSFCFSYFDNPVPPLGSTPQALYRSQRLRLNEMHMVAVTWNTSSRNGPTLDVDGQQMPPPPILDGVQVERAHEQTCIGGGFANSPPPPNRDYAKALDLFTGDIFELIAYGDILTLPQIQFLHQYMQMTWGAP